MKKHLSLTLTLMAALLQVSCGDIGDEPAFGDGGPGAGTVSTVGIPAVENFRIDLGEGYAMTVFDADDPRIYSPDETNSLIVTAYDHSGAPVSNLTVNFSAEWGVLPGGTSCVTDTSGTCSVAWAISDPSTVPTDYCVRVVAYTTGEESYYDSNGNNIFDNLDTTFAGIPTPFVNGFLDVPDPYYDTNGDSVYTFGTDIPVPGFGTHTPADGQYNGSQTCTTTSLCSTTNTITIWDDTYMDLKDETTATVPAASNTCI